MSLPPGATLVSGSLPPQLPLGATLISGTVPSFKPPVDNSSISAAPKASGIPMFGWEGMPIEERLATPLGKAIMAASDKMHEVENLTQEGHEQHPVQAWLGDKANALDEFLFGGQAAGKPMGTSAGAADLAAALSGATDVAALGPEVSSKISKLVVSPGARVVAKKVATTLLNEVPGYKTVSEIASLPEKVTGPITLPVEAFDTSEAEKGIRPFEGVGKEPAPTPPPSVRRVPGEIKPEQVSSGKTATVAGPSTGNIPLAESGGVLQRPVKALPAGTPNLPEGATLVSGTVPPPKVSLRDLANQVTDQNIPPGPKLASNVPLRQQPLTRGTPGSRVAMDVSATSGPTVKAAEKVSTALPEEVGKQMGAPPLQKGVSLRDQIKNPTAQAGESEQARLERLYPDKGVRQIVHSEGEQFVQAAGGDKDLIKAGHDLTNPEVRQAMINSGEDMVAEDGSPIQVQNRKATGNQMTRQEAFKRLFAKGHTIPEIVKMAKTAPLSQMANP